MRLNSYSIPIHSLKISIVLLELYMHVYIGLNINNKIDDIYFFIHVLSLTLLYGLYARTSSSSDWVGNFKDWMILSPWSFRSDLYYILIYLLYLWYEKIHNSQEYKISDLFSHVDYVVIGIVIPKTCNLSQSSSVPHLSWAILIYMPNRTTNVTTLTKSSWRGSMAP